MKNETLNGSLPKRNLIVEITASLLLIFFVHSFITSYLHIKSLKNLLAFYTLSTGEVAWAIVVTETIISILLFTPRTRNLGLVFSLLFAITGLFITVRNPYIPHDFGGFVNYISPKQQYLLYVLLGLLSIIGIVGSKIKTIQLRRGLTPSIKHN